ncbi:transposase [Natronolimnobius sp. AArcel1]|uniref:transposase n=1 Tax=Natronolimnobius sp. AArcel1 TaxID=1679093 RepID=UPI0013EAE47A|nr:transposase [Natronolimnobius sp. AArcel1]NGM70888.1 transposase [Natronolimnobius sp. AArcel1]
MTGKKLGGESHTPHSSRTRRQLLAGLAAATSTAVAGCQSLPGFGDESTPTYTPAEADTVLESDGPTLEWPVPVEPDADALEDALERTDTLIDEIPEPLEESHIPNGVIRETIDENRLEAMAGRDEAADTVGADRYHALRDAREQHKVAREAATAWLAIDADRDDLLTELRDEYDAVQSALADRRAEPEYRGEDTDAGRLRATLYAFQRDGDLQHAERTLNRWDVHEADDVLEIGESAGDLELGTTTTRIWAHFDERYASGIADGDGDHYLEAVFEDTLEQSIERANEADFPSQDGESEAWYEAVGLDGFDGTRSLESVIWQAGSSIHQAHESMEDTLEAETFGLGLQRALEFEQSLRGFERVRDRIADGDVEAPDDSDEIRAQRAAALEAAQTARDAVPLDEPSLGAYRLAETLQELSWTDDAVARAASRDPEMNVTLTDEYGEYAKYQAELEVLPEAVEAFRDRLLER